MEKNISPTGKLSLIEAKKSLRDAGLVLIATGLIQLMETAQITDFGEYQLIATILLAAISPLINRFTNSVRI